MDGSHLLSFAGLLDAFNVLLGCQYFSRNTLDERDNIGRFVDQEDREWPLRPVKAPAATRHPPYALSLINYVISLIVPTSVYLYVNSSL